MNEHEEVYNWWGFSKTSEIAKKVSGHCYNHATYIKIEIWYK